MPETLFLSAIDPGVKNPTSFHFAVRDFNDALLGIGTRNGDLVTFTGVDGKRGGRQLEWSALASQIELEGVEDFDGFRAIDQRTLRDVEKAVQQFLETQHHHVALSKSNCYSTVKYLMMPEDQEVPDRLLQRHQSFLWCDPQYFNLEDWEGCLTSTTKSELRRNKCLACSKFEVILTAEGGLTRWGEYRKVGGRHKFELSKKFVKDKDYSQCKHPVRVDEQDLTKLCPPERKQAEEVAEYWNRQIRKYLPDCNFLIDTKARPYRLSGICDTRDSGSTIVEFDFASHDTDFWEKTENSQQDFAYQDNRQYHQNNQYSSDTPPESESDSSFGGYLK